MGIPSKITQFEGEYFFLSNFYFSPLWYEGIQYPTAEHAFQAQKTDNPEWRERIHTALTPAVAKKLGRSCPLRERWEIVRRGIMGKVLRMKFLENPPLLKKLLDTGDAILVEGNSWGDRFWGVDAMTGVGQNHLGKLLMTVRGEARHKVATGWLKNIHTSGKGLSDWETGFIRQCRAESLTERQFRALEGIYAHRT